MCMWVVDRSKLDLVTKLPGNLYFRVRVLFVIFYVYFQVSVLHGGGHACGGTLISDRLSNFYIFEKEKCDLWIWKFKLTVWNSHRFLISISLFYIFKVCPHIGWMLWDGSPKWGWNLKQIITKLSFFTFSSLHQHFLFFSLVDHQHPGLGEGGRSGSERAGGIPGENHIKLLSKRKLSLKCFQLDSGMYLFAIGNRV